MVTTDSYVLSITLENYVSKLGWANLIARISLRLITGTATSYLVWTLLLWMMLPLSSHTDFTWPGLGFDLPVRCFEITPFLTPTSLPHPVHLVFIILLLLFVLYHKSNSQSRLTLTYQLSSLSFAGNSLRRASNSCLVILILLWFAYYSKSHSNCQAEY